MSGYLDYSGRDDVLSGGVRKVPVPFYSQWYH
jgi:hypothetical protein